MKTRYILTEANRVELVNQIVHDQALPEDEAFKIKELCENVRHAEEGKGTVEIKNKQATLINKVASKVTHGAQLGLKLLNARFRIFGSTAVTIIKLDGDDLGNLENMLDSIEAI